MHRNLIVATLRAELTEVLEILVPGHLVEELSRNAHTFPMGQQGTGGKA
jgi:hypothetical protein